MQYKPKRKRFSRKKNRNKAFFIATIVSIICTPLAIAIPFLIANRNSDTVGGGATEDVPPSPYFTTNPYAKNNRWQWSDPVHEARLSPDGNYVALYHIEKKVLAIYENSTANLVKLIVDCKYLFDVQFSSVGTFFTLRSAKSASLYQFDQFYRLQEICDENQVGGVALSPDGNYVAVGGEDAKITKLYSRTNERYLTPIPHEIGAHAYAFSPDSRYLAVADHSGRVKIYDIEQSSLCVFDVGDLYGNRVECLTFSHDGNHLFMGCKDETVKSYSLAKLSRHQDPITEILELDNKIISISLCGKRKYLAIAHENNTVTLYSIHDSKILSVIKHDDDITCLAFSPDRRYLATASSDATVKLYSIAAQELLDTICHGSGLGGSSLAFTPDNRYLVSASNAELVATDLKEYE